MKSKIKIYKIGTKVSWKWLGHFILGTVEEIHLKSVSKLIKEKNIKRNGSKINPAYLVKSSAGNLALKLHSELQLQNKEKATKRKPQIFSGD